MLNSYNSANKRMNIEISEYLISTTRNISFDFIHFIKCTILVRQVSLDEELFIAIINRVYWASLSTLRDVEFTLHHFKTTQARILGPPMTTV